MDAKCRSLQLSSQQTTLCIIGRTWRGKKENARWDDGTMGRRKRRSAFYFSIIAIFIGMQREPLRRRESLQSFPCLSTRREHLSVVLRFPKVSVLESLLYHNYSPCLIFAQTQRTPYSIRLNVNCREGAFVHRCAVVLQFCLLFVTKFSIFIM